MSIKDDTILIRINHKDKIRIKIRVLEKGFNSLSEYVMYCCMKDLSEDEFINRHMISK